MEYLSTPTEQTINAGTCLASYVADWLCTYNPAGVPTYLEFGGALTAVGLILAVYQLRKPKWEIVLSMRPFWQRWAFIFLGGIGLLLVLVKSIVISLVGYSSLPVTNPALFDIFAYLAFVASPVCLIYFAEQSRGLFNERNARRFYETVVIEVSTSDETRQSSALLVLLDNFEPVCKALKTADRKSESYQSAVAVFDVVLSETSIVEYLTTKKLNSLLYIFSLIEKYGITKQIVNVGVPSLIRSLLLNNQSFAYKHRSNEGLSMSLSVYEQIFKSPKLISGFNFFGYPAIKYSWRGNVNSITVDVIIEALSSAIETHYTNNGVSVRHISEGFELLGDIFNDTCLKISIEEGRGVDTERELEDDWRILSEISRFLSHGYLYIAYRKTFRDGVAEDEAQAIEANENASAIVNEAYAYSLYKALSSLTWIPKTLFKNSHVRTDVLHGIIFEGQQKQGYQKPFTDKLWKKIFYNLREKHYPAVIWVYLDMMGYFLSGEDTGGEGWAVEEARKLRRLLYLDLKPMIEAGENMINEVPVQEALLPVSIKYENGDFIYHSGNKLSKAVIIAKPKEGEKPMMEGFEPKEDDRAYWWSG